MTLLITYRLIGENMPELQKEFKTEEAYQVWKNQQINIFIISEIEIKTLGEK